FLVHYPIVLWLQYWLFDFDLPAIVKAVVAFVLTVALSWAATAALRKIPGATRVLGNHLSGLWRCLRPSAPPFSANIPGISEKPDQVSLAGLYTELVFPLRKGRDHIL